MRMREISLIVCSLPIERLSSVMVYPSPNVSIGGIIKYDVFHVLFRVFLFVTYVSKNVRFVSLFVAESENLLPDMCLVRIAIRYPFRWDNVDASMEMQLLAFALV